MNAADTALADARALWQEHPNQETFERLFRASVAAGRPLDSLDTYDPNEERRVATSSFQPGRQGQQRATGTPSGSPERGTNKIT